MKLFLTFLTITLNLTIVIGQLDSEYVDLLYQKIRWLQPEGTIYYADKPDKKTFQYLYPKLKSRKFLRKGQNDSMLIITKEEQQYLIAELDKSLHSKLPNNLFENSKRLSSDSIILFVDKLNLRMYDSIRHLPDSSQIKSAWRSPLHYWSFMFTNPIYIRNRTISLQYFMYYTLSGGENYLAFYKKGNGKWIKWINVGGGAW